MSFCYYLSTYLSFFSSGSLSDKVVGLSGALQVFAVWCKIHKFESSSRTLSTAAPSCPFTRTHTHIHTDAHRQLRLLLRLRVVVYVAIDCLFSLYSQLISVLLTCCCPSCCCCCCGSCHSACQQEVVASFSLFI